MDDASLQKSQIDEIVLVGGSTRIPKVQQLLKDFFEGKEPNKGVNPTRTRGCCLWCFCSVQGGILSREGGDETKYILLLDVAPLTLGIGTVGYSNQEFSGEPLKLDAVNQRRLQSQTRRVV